MIHFDASRAKHQTTERNRYILLAWINLLYYLTCPNTDLLGIIPSRFGGKINFLGGLPVYFSLNKLGLPSKSEKLYLFYLAHRIQQPISKSWIFINNFNESKWFWQKTIGKQGFILTNYSFECRFPFLNHGIKLVGC